MLGTLLELDRYPVIVFQSGAYAVLGSGDVDLYREVGMDSAHSFYDIRGFPLRRVARGSMVCFGGGGPVALLCDQFSSSVCKPFFERYRPARDPDFSSMVTIVNGYRGGMFGFFSSHAANAAGIVVYTALIFRNKLYAATAVLWALLTCYSRMYLGVHYPGDILAGLLWG